MNELDTPQFLPDSSDVLRVPVDILDIAGKVDVDPVARARLVIFLMVILADDPEFVLLMLPGIEAELPVEYARFLEPMKLGAEVLRDRKLAAELFACSDEIQIRNLLIHRLNSFRIEIVRAVSALILQASRCRR